jgi:glycosyltransferase involved in cell wall biosynthesis
MNPLISIVIPTYNHAHFLRKSLRSVLDQSYQKWEAIVVDNHSDDNTEEVIREFQEPRFRMLKIQNHGVIAASRNMGIRDANGEWVAFLDSDDLWYPQKLETLVDVIKSDDYYDVLSGDEYKVNRQSGSKSILRYGPQEDDFYQRLILDGNRLSPSATMIRRSFLERHRLTFGESKNFVTVEDYDLWLNLARTGAKFKFLRDVLGEYIVHGTNNSASFDRHWSNCEKLLRTHIFEIQKFEKNPQRLWRHVAFRLDLVKAWHLYRTGHRSAAASAALKATFSSPEGWIKQAYFRFRRYCKIKISQRV